MPLLFLSDETIQIAADALAAGGLVAFPTETVYGLGADAFNPAALARVFEVKGRPHFDPLIIHIADLDSLERVADLSALEPSLRNKAEILGQRLWPGPLTLILPKVQEIPSLATSGLPTAAIRLPDHGGARKLIRRSTGAVAAPSANPFGYLSPTRAEHVQEQLGNRVDFILDGGPAGVGIESTVLDLSAGPPRILRPGGTPQECIEAIIGPVEVPCPAGSVPRSPGQLTSHYAPRTPLTLHSTEEMIALPYRSTEGYLFFSGDSRRRWFRAFPAPAQIQTLSETGNLSEAAARLFDLLHALDKGSVSAIRAERVPETGLGIAVNDRLSRAGAKLMRGSGSFF